jgi:hypothetical protein
MSVMLWAYNRRRAGYFGIACKRHTGGWACTVDVYEIRGEGGRSE